MDVIGLEPETEINVISPELETSSVLTTEQQDALLGRLSSVVFDDLLNRTEDAGSRAACPCW